MDIAACVRLQTTHQRDLGAFVLVVVLAAWLAAGASAQAATSPWKVIASPNQGFGDNILYGVAALSASDAWAVGMVLDGGPGPVIEHWNGTAWTLTPSGVTNGFALEAISAPSASDIWAAGVTQSDRPLIEHYNGSHWAGVSSPPGMSSVGGISATSATDVWVAAYKFLSDGNIGAFLDRWNGSTWTAHRYDTADPDGGIGPGSPVAFSSSNVWVADYHYSGEGPSFTYVKQWNGTTVVTQAGPTAPDPTDNHFYSLAASSPSDIWVAGTWDSAATSSTPLYGPIAGYWNGSKWITPTLPAAYPAYGHTFQAIAPVSPSNVWAVGDRSGGYNLLAHWNGTAWTEWAGPNPTTANGLNGVAAIPGTTGAWAVGATGTSPEKTMILRCC